MFLYKYTKKLTIFKSRDHSRSKKKKVLKQAGVVYDIKSQ